MILKKRYCRCLDIPTTVIESTPPVDVATVGVCDCSQLPELTLAVIPVPDDCTALNTKFIIVIKTSIQFLQRFARGKFN